MPETMAETAVVRRDDRRAREVGLAELIARELPAAYRTAAVILGDQGEAEDATQDALVRTWQHWARLRDGEHAGAWFGRILINVCRDRLRARRTRAVTWLLLEPTGQPAQDSGEREALWQAIGDLSPDHRIVIVLRYYLDLPLEAIAQRTAVPLGTVKSRLHHALGSMRAAYDAQQRNPEALR
jgi:RNA polymerase sigma factor (sigma-70 family)